MIWEIGGGKRMIKEYITTYDPARGGAYLRNIGGLTKKEVKKLQMIISVLNQKRIF